MYLKSFLVILYLSLLLSFSTCYISQSIFSKNQFHHGGTACTEEHHDGSQSKNKVEIRLYDIGNGVQPFIEALARKKLECIWHTGVAVYGCEYWFSTQIEMIDLKDTESAFGMAPLHTFDLGETTLSKNEFENYLENVLADSYCIEKYDLLYHNCNHFANDVSLYLTGRPIPRNVLNLSEELLSQYGALQADITKFVSNKIARYVMVAWGRQNRKITELSKNRKVFLSKNLIENN